jgi:hypothetical protein
MAEMNVSGLNLILELIARRRRVIAFLNAISELRTGDLQVVLNLDETCPKNVVDLPQHDPDDVTVDGEEFASILEEWLHLVLFLAAFSLHSTEEQNWGLGNRRFAPPKEGLK